MKRPRFSPATSGFTLVEILVTVAIIATLAGLSTIAIGSGIRSAHRSKCLSNLRQIGVGLELYLQDHNQRMPVLVAARRSRHDDEPALETVLIDYLENELVFKCPADPEEFAQTGSSYMWNTTQNGTPVSQLLFFNTDDPSRIPIVIDKEAWHPGGGDGTSNILYADRSAENRLRLGVNR